MTGICMHTLAEENLSYGLSQAFRDTFEVSEQAEELYRKCGLVDVLQSARRKHGRWMVLVQQVQAQGVLGLVLRNDEDTRWCMITRDPKPNMFRYSVLDARGFIGHGEYHKPTEALIEAFRMGYQYLSYSTKPDEVIASPEWIG